MSNVSRILMLLSATALLRTAHAEELDVSLVKTSGSPAYGSFYGYRTVTEGPSYSAFADLKAMADREHVPLFVIFSANGCSHCDGFAANLNAEASMLLNWMPRRNALFGYFKGTDPSDGNISPSASAAAYNFIVSLGLTPGFFAYPLWGYYYNSREKGVRSGYGTFAQDTWTAHSTGAYSAESFSNFVDDVLWDAFGDAMYRNVGPQEGDAVFACGMTESARLEAMPTTAAVYVPLKRVRNADAANTNTVVATFPDGTTLSTDVIWNPTDVEADARVDVAGHYLAGDIVKLSLYDSSGTLNATNFITFVAEQENSSMFPYCPGEKTVDELTWGDWTMDFPAATNKVRLAAAAGISAYTLVMAGGALWCPDCTNIEQYVYDTAAFARWAESNHVILAVLDQPRMGMTAPTFSTHDIDSRNGKSGSSYLSRKGLTTAQGRAIFDSTSELSQKRWPDGFLINPGASRLANPEVLLLRADGSVAGRMNWRRLRVEGLPKNSSAEPFALEENLARLDELLHLARASGNDSEELDNWPGLTPLKWTEGPEVGFSLQASDTCDVYSLQCVKAGDIVRFSPTITNGANVDVTVSVLAPESGSGSSLKCVDIPSAGDGVWRLTQSQIDGGLYISISAYGDARYVDYGGKSACAGTVSMKVLPPDHGVVAFTSEEMPAAKESDGRLAVQVSRSRGSSGRVAARIDLDLESTTAPDSAYVWDASNTNAHMLVWEDFEYGVKSLWVPVNQDGIYTGDRKVGFKLVAVELDGVTPDIDHDGSQCTVQILESDRLAPGDLAIVDSSPVAVAGSVVEVPAGGTFSLTVARVGGSQGSVSAGFLVSNPSVGITTETLVWHENDIEDKKATFTVPELSSFEGSPVFTVELDPDDGAGVVPSRRRVKVRVVEPDRPAFDIDSLACEILQLCHYYQSVTIDDERFASAEVEVLSGSLPAGVSADWDGLSGTLTVSGTAKKPGEYSTTLRLAAEGDDGAAEVSLPVSFSFSVLPIEDYAPQLLESHDFRSLPVVHRGGSCERARVVGSIDVSLPLSGRLSARYRREGGNTVSIPFAGWNGFDASAGVTASASSQGVTVCITAALDGGFDISVVDPDYGEMAVTAQRSAPWGYDDSAAAWAGTYTVSCPYEASSDNSASPYCTGGASVMARMSSGAASSGRMSIAGVLPNGHGFSGSTILVRGNSWSSLPIFFASPSETFGGVFSIESDGSSRITVVTNDVDVSTSWTHRERSAPELDTLQYYGAYGSWLDPDASLAIGGVVLDGNDEAIPSGVTVNQSTGAFKGTFSEKGQKVGSFAGVVTPGWNSLGSGSWWKTAIKDYQGADGVWRKAQVTIGGAVGVADSK